MPRKRILFAQSYVHPVGGGSAVTAWAIQTLACDFEVSLAMLGPIDIAALNRAFGTSLTDADFHRCIAPAKYRAVLKVLPVRGALLETSMVASWMREVDREHHFDLLLTVQNEMDLGRPGIQYVHYPTWYFPRPEIEMRWFHRIPGFLHLYRGLCRRLSGTTFEGIRSNLTLANSQFVADRCQAAHGVAARLVPPPVPGNFPEVAWENRRPAFVAVGRFSSVKRWPMVVEILEKVRRRGHEIGFTLIGQPDDAAEARRLQALARTRPWFRMLTNLTRQELAVEIAAHRYGIHAMEDEHFGIAVAELQRAGCITFVHASGGPPEIVGNDPRLIFRDVPEAAEKISRVLADDETSRSLRALVESRRECYSTDRFCADLRQAVVEFLSGQK